MNLPRIFANAFARKIAAVVVVSVLAWMGVGQARAQQPAYTCNSTNGPCDRGQAFAECQAWLTYQAGVGFGTGQECTYFGDSLRFYRGRACNNSYGCSAGGITTRDFSFLKQCSAGYEWQTSTNTCQQACTTGQERNSFTGRCQISCSTRPAGTVTSTAMIPNGSQACANGCQVVVSYAGDGIYRYTPKTGAGNQCGTAPDCTALGSGYTYNVQQNMCQPVLDTCASNQTKDPATGQCTDGCAAGMVMDAMGVCKPKAEDCPAGNVRSPAGECLPGDGQCSAGEARRKDGTCGKDSDGDGEADIDDDDPENDDDKESFSGGDNCNAPPSCSGGPIDCGMARIQWRIECNTRKNTNIAGGACSAMPVCTGEKCDAMEYAQLVQGWKTACALEKLAGKEGNGNGTGDANGNGVADVLEGSIEPGNGGGDDNTSVLSFGINTGMLDQENIFGGGSCPQPPTFQLMGQTISGSDFPHWCNAMAILRALILIFGAFTALKILMGGTF